MKKINSLFYIIGIVCIVVAVYILIGEVIADNDANVNFNEDEEIVLLNNKLTEVGSPLGWIIIASGINNQDNDGNYVINFEENLLGDYKYRQLFVMEYVLSNINNYDNFVVLSAFNHSKSEDNPTDDYTLAYLEYDEYNSYYKSLFGEDFDLNKAMKGNTKYDKTHVYYENKRAGSNGVYVSMIQASEVEYNNGTYIGKAIVTYSTRASELVGASVDTAIIEYTKDINDNIIFKSFSLEDR